MDRFYELLTLYQDEILDARERAELADFVDRDPVCLEAFLDVVSAQRIERMALQSN
jgi:hypothetical protein